MKSLLALVGVLVASQFAVAQSSQTLPAGFDTTAGGENWNHFLGTPANNYSNTRFQAVYDTTEFADQGFIAITKLAFRAKPGYSGGYAAGSMNNVTVRMSSCANDFNSLSQTFANNTGADVATVFSGTVSYPAVVGTTTVNDWVEITLTTPFTFQAAAGNDLCIEVSKCGTPNFAKNIDCDDDSGAAKQVHNHDSCSSSTGLRPQTKVPVFRITYGTCLAQQAQVGVNCGTLTLNGTPPIMGQSGTLTLTGGTPFGPGLIAYSGTAAMNSPVSYLGCNVYLDYASFSVLTSFDFDANGEYSLTATLPSDPFVLCLEAVLQAVEFRVEPLNLSNAFWVKFGN